MEYNDELFTKLQRGWDEPKESEVNWNCVRKNISNLIANGIQPMLDDLLGINHGKIMPTEKCVRILAPDNFIRVVSLEHLRVPTVKDYLETLDNTQLIVDYKNEYGHQELSTEGYMEAIALFGYQLIREDTSMKSLALHLVCHEMMHTIASERAVESLRSENLMGDEAVNEFFARLATQYLIASGVVDKKLCGITTTEEMKSMPTLNHDDWGAYGKRIKTSCDICKVVNSSNKLSALKALARFYFLGEERPK